MRVLFFLSEILSAKTLLPVWRRLEREPATELRALNDGFCVEFVHSLDLPVETCLDQFQDHAASAVDWADVIVSGKSYRQRSEYVLLELAEEMGKPMLLALPDMGAQIVWAKLQHPSGNGRLHPKFCLLADKRTRAGLVAQGMDSSSLYVVGNPYFDDIYERVRRNSRVPSTPQTVAYFSTPFELDHQRGILDVPYSHRQFVQEMRDTVESLGLRFVAKNHPQVASDSFRGIEVVDGHPLDLIEQVSIALGSYTSTLLEAYAASVPAISYQPWRTPIRGDVFQDRVPVVRHPQDLRNAILEALAFPVLEPGPQLITSNPGTSVEAFVKLIRVAATQPKSLEQSPSSARPKPV